MKLDRRRFLTLAFAMAAAPGCVVREEPEEHTSGAEETAPRRADNVAVRDNVDDVRSERHPISDRIAAPIEPGHEPTDECVDWSQGECVAWAPFNEQYGPGSVCIEHTRAGQCTEWEPVPECVEWTPAGECIDWS